MRRRPEQAERDNSDRWLLTYADLITLLMIFFVVLYAISKVDAEKFKAIAESLSKTLGGGGNSIIEVVEVPSGSSILDGTSGYGDSSTADDDQGSGHTGQGDANVENMTIEGIKARLDQFANDNGFQTKLVSSIEERGLVISIQDTLLFESGSAMITSSAQAILNKISTVLVTVPNYIRVEGHTDNLPINTPQFPSNWELSVLRATNVVQVLVTDGGLNSERLSATGYGEYRPIADNQTEAGRNRNRRVDLIILRSKYDLVEPESTKF